MPRIVGRIVLVMSVAILLAGGVARSRAGGFRGGAPVAPDADTGADDTSVDETGACLDSDAVGPIRGHPCWPAEPAGGITVAAPALAREILAESGRCWFAGRGYTYVSRAMIGVVGLDTGRFALLSVYDVTGGPEPTHITSLTRIGDVLVAVVAQGGPWHFQLMTWDPRTGRMSPGPAFNETSLYRVGSALVGEDWSDLDIRLPDRFTVYETAEQLYRGVPARTVTSFLPSTRFGNGEDLLPGMWHAGSEVRLYDLRTGRASRYIHLQHFEGWVTEVQAWSDRLFVLEDDRGEWGGYGQRLGVFDRETGANLDNIFLARDVVLPDGSPTSVMYDGLYCERRE